MITKETKQVYEQAKKMLELLGIYEYLFGAINNYKVLKSKIGTLEPIKIPISDFNFLSEDSELLKQAVKRFNDIGIAVKLEGDQCVIG